MLKLTSAKYKGKSVAMAQDSLTFVEHLKVSVNKFAFLNVFLNQRDFVM